ncbi:MAG: hypothetical protein OEW75_16360, partial [Cyclobacteriaceae bacterium]|nr:hypothetical protein [Cyclobacteriaceae bacterium]
MNFKLVTENKANDQVRVLLNNTVLGNEGGMRYKHVNTLEKINHLVNPYFISLFKGDRLLGTINLTQR